MKPGNALLPVTKKLLPIPYGIAAGIEDISFYIHPKCYKKIEDNGRANGKKRDINKVLADGAGGNAHFFANGCAYAKHMPFYKMLQLFHTIKIIDLAKTPGLALYFFSTI